MRCWLRSLLLVLGFLPLVGAADPVPLETLVPHPRLLVSDAELTAIATAPADTLRSQLKTHIYGMAGKVTASTIESAATVLANFHTQVPDPTEFDWQGLSLHKGRRVQGVIIYLALASRMKDLIDHDPVASKRFGQLAIRQMMAVSAADFAWDFTGDNAATGNKNYANKFLNVAEMMFGVAVGYDWLYAKADWWILNGMDQRPVVAQALYTKGLKFAYGGSDADPTQSTATYRVKGPFNWAQVANASTMATALALAKGDFDLATDLPRATVDVAARRTIGDARDSLQAAQTMYAPAGAYAEGLGYWNYGTGYQVFAVAMLESALGGRGQPWVQSAVQPLWDHEGFRATSWFRVCVVGPTGLGFSYADTGYDVGRISKQDDPSLALTWLTKRFSQTDLEAVSRRNLAADNLAIPSAISDTTFFSSYGYPLHYVWLPSPGGSTAGSGNLDYVFAGQPLGQRDTNATELAFFRNNAADAKSLWVAVKGGASGLNHSHADLGSFCLDQGGARWAEDLGADDYGQPGYFDDDVGGQRWSYLLCGTEGHNLLSPGSFPQDFVTLAPITGFSATPSHAWTTVDVTRMYPGTARRMVRGIELIDQRQQVLIQDDVEGLQPGIPLTWRMITAASVSTAAGNRTLTRTVNGVQVQMALEVLEPAGADITVAAINSLPGHSNSFPGYSRISVRVPPQATVRDVQVVVRLRPVTRARTTISLPRAKAWEWTPESAPALPVITSPTMVAVTPGRTVAYQVTATNGPWTNITVTGLPAWLTWYPETAMLRGDAPADMTGSVPITVQATNVTGTGSATVTFSPATMVLPMLTTTPVAGRVGQSLGTIKLVTNTLPLNPLPGSIQSVRAIGLPPGLTLNANARLSGTPTMAGTFRVHLEVQTPAGTTSGEVSMVIDPALGSTAGAVLVSNPTTLDLP